jgi:hypothetical protein
MEQDPFDDDFGGSILDSTAPFVGGAVGITSWTNAAGSSASLTTATSPTVEFNSFR